MTRMRFAVAPLLWSAPTHKHVFCYQCGVLLFVQLCSLASYLNHSCVPNCKWHLDVDSEGDTAGKLVITATKPIKRDEQLFVSYATVCFCVICVFESIGVVDNRLRVSTCRAFVTVRIPLSLSSLCA